MDDEKEMMAFSWIYLFFVTSICFLMFSLMLTVLDGTRPAFLLKAAAVSFILGLVCLATKKTKKTQEF